MAGYLTAGAVSQDSFNVAMADLMSSPRSGTFECTICKETREVEVPNNISQEGHRKNDQADLCGTPNCSLAKSFVVLAAFEPPFCLEELPPGIAEEVEVSQKAGGRTTGTPLHRDLTHFHSSDAGDQSGLIRHRSKFIDKIGFRRRELKLIDHVEFTLLTPLEFTDQQRI
jgi:hypothetical protein